MRIRAKRHVWLLGALAVAAFGCAAEPEPTKTAEKGATFNFVPLNDDSCVLPENEEALTKAGDVLASLNGGYSTAVALELKLCADCADNKFLAALNSVTKNVTINGVDVAPPLADLVNKSLAYPYRDLIVAWQDDADQSNIVLAQAAQQGATEEASYVVQPESLDKACAAYNNKITAKITNTTAEDGVTTSDVTTADPGSRAFGFKVPTVLPDLTADEFEIARQLAAVPGLAVRVTKPEISFKADGAGNGTGKLEGWVELTDLTDLTSSGVDLTPFVDEGSGAIRIVLTFKLAPAAITSAIPADQMRASPPTEDDVGTVTAPLTQDYTKSWDNADMVTNFRVACPECKNVGAPVPAQAANWNCYGPSFSDRQTLRMTGPTKKFNIAARYDFAPYANWAKAAKQPLSPITFQTLNVFAPMGSIYGIPKPPADLDGASEIEMTVNRPWRAGTGMMARPRCAKIIADATAAGKPIPAINYADGWMQYDYYTRALAGFGSCRRSIYICQDFSSEQVCSKGKVLLDDTGTCGCPKGSLAVGPSCYTLADAKCPVDATGLSWDAAKSAPACICPAGKAHDTVAGTCAAPACASNAGLGGCKAGEICRAADAFKETCIAPPAQALVAKEQPNTALALGKLYDAAVAKATAKMPGKTMADAMTLNRGSALADDPGTELAAPKGQALSRPDLAVVEGPMHFFGKSYLGLVPDFPFKANGQQRTVAGQILQHRSYRGIVHHFQMVLSPKNAAALMAAAKSPTGLGQTVRMNLWRFQYYGNPGVPPQYRYYRSHGGYGNQEYKLLGFRAMGPINAGAKSGVGFEFVLGAIGPSWTVPLLFAPEPMRMVQLPVMPNMLPGF